MSDYTKATDFAAKDVLLTGNPAKLVKGTEIDTEFNNIATAVATKYDSADLGVTLQQYDADLAAIAGLTSAADKVPYFTGSGTADVATMTAFARSILDDADEATFKATVNLEIGTDVQAYDAELAALASLTSAANKVPMFSGSGTATVLDFKDEDDMVSDSATAVPSQQSVKAYVDASVGGGVTSGTVTDTSTGATSYTVTGIPAGAKFISFGYGGISTNGTSSVMIRVGPSGGVVNTGYVGALFDNVTATQPTDGFYIDNFGAAAAVRHGMATLQLIDASTNTWSWRSDVLSSDSNRGERTSSGTISLAGALERFQLIANGTDTFDAGKLNYLVWE